MLKRISLTCIVMCVAAVAIHAQSYTEHLQKQQSGNGTVTVNQSKELEALINGSAPKTTTGTTKSTAATTKTAANKPATTTTSTPSTAGTTTAKSSSETREERKPTPSRESYTSKTENENKNIVRRERDRETITTSTGTSTDSRKKIMVGSRKVTGYRIQVYSGGNSRKDRERAQQAGNRVKAQFPSYPIYVHFYSPSWKCRVGNFVEYKDAEQALRRIRGMGYPQAVIVKGKISVQ